MKVFQKNSNIFNLLSEGVSEGILVVNEKQLIVAANGSAHTMFGYSDEELVGQKLDILIPSKYRRGHKVHVSTFIKGSEKRQMGKGRDLFGRKKNGQEFPVEAGLNPLQIYGNSYTMALVSDITERKAYTENLEKMVSKRTQQLEEALVAEKELGDLKTKFLSLVSHEFKTPLSSILTSTTLLAKYTETAQQDKRDKHLKTIKSKVKYLDNILNDFLSVERLESGKVNYNQTTFPLSKVVNEVVYDSNMLLKEGQRILYPQDIDDIILEFDEKILELALSNLVHNAIKYSPENKVIDIRVSKDKTSFFLEIIDEGIGIPKAEQKFIFERYFRAGNALLNQGTGIGLNIAKRHLENLGGDITFNSIENKGTTFKIKVPVQAPKSKV